MRTVRLGRTGLEVSRIGIGGIPLTRPTFDDAAELVRRALDLGVSLIDTATGYRDSEARVGRGIRGRREEVVVATKTPARDRETATRHLEMSLRRLGTDRVDLWQLHNVARPEDYAKVLGPGGAYEAAVAARQAGKVRFIGLTSHSKEMAVEAAESGLFDTIQYPFNFVSSEATERLIGLCRERDLGFLAMKPFAGGMIESAELAIRFVLLFPEAVPIPGVEKIEEVEEITRIADDAASAGSNRAGILSSQQLAAMEELRAEVGSRFCRQCEYCLPCPQGVKIPSVMALPKHWRRWPREHMLSWTGIHDAVRSAGECTECGECEAKCPYQLPIRDLIKEYTEMHRRMMQSGEGG